MAFSDEQKNKIITALQEKGVSSTCYRCQKQEWVLMESWTPINIQPDIKNMTLGGEIIPAIALVCKNCGHIELHASKPLAGIPEDKSNE